MPVAASLCKSLTSTTAAAQAPQAEWQHQELHAAADARRTARPGGEGVESSGSDGSYPTLNIAELLKSITHVIFVLSGVVW